MTTIRVQGNAVTLGGVDPLQLNDILADAPEPALPGASLRATSANLLYLFERLPSATWEDPQGRLMEARAHRLVNAQGRPEPGEYEKTWPFKMQPRDYQLRIFAAARHMKYFALAPVVMGCVDADT